MSPTQVTQGHSDMTKFIAKYSPTQSLMVKDKRSTLSDYTPNWNTNIAVWSTIATVKTATPTIDIEPNLKEALHAAAQAEHRFIANMVEVMIREHCEKNGIAIEQSQELDQHGERL